MVFTIKSLYEQAVEGHLDFLKIMEQGGIVEFDDIKERSDANTAFEFDDTKPTLITFIYTDANRQVAHHKVDLAPFGLTYQYVLDKIRPVFEMQ